MARARRSDWPNLASSTPLGIRKLATQRVNTSKSGGVHPNLLFTLSVYFLSDQRFSHSIMASQSGAMSSSCRCTFPATLSPPGDLRTEARHSYALVYAYFPCRLLACVVVSLLASRNICLSDCGVGNLFASSPGVQYTSRLLRVCPPLRISSSRPSRQSYLGTNTGCIHKHSSNIWDSSPLISIILEGQYDVQLKK